MKARIGIFAAAVIATAVATLAFAGDQDPRVASNLDFEVDTSPQLMLPIIVPDNGQNKPPVSYTSDKVEFSVGKVSTFDGDGPVVYDEPFFCFGNAASPHDGTVLKAFDPNGHVIIEDVAIETSLLYLPQTQAISFAPGASSYCFYKNNGDDFGLFGQLMQTEPEPSDRFFADEFSGFSDLSIEYHDLPAQVMDGDEITYQLRIKNDGKGHATELSLQEVFPANQSVYGAVLGEGSWECFASGQHCPALSGNGNLRFTDLNLPAGANLTFEITRTVAAIEPLSVGTIDLHAAVLDSGAIVPRFDTAEAALPVVGAPSALHFEQGPTDTPLGEPFNPSIVVHVRDANGNLVTTDNVTLVSLRLIDNGIPQSPHLHEMAVSGGVAAFTGADEFSLPSGLNPGTRYRLRATATNLDYNIDLVDSDFFAIGSQ